MKLGAQAILWFLALIIIASISLVCIVQVNSIRAEKQSFMADIRSIYKDLDSKYEIANSRWKSLMDSMNIDRSSKKAYSEGARVQTRPAIFAFDAIDNLFKYVRENNDTTSSGLDELPSIPQGIPTEYIMDKDIIDIEKDALINPQNKTLTRIEKARARAELSRAQGMGRFIDSEIDVEVAMGMEDLRKDGAFVEYASGEQYQVIPGVITAAEIIRGGVRMFYYYPEKFKDIYDLKERRKIIAEECLGRLIALFSYGLKGK